MGLGTTFRTQGHMNAVASFGPDIDLNFATLQAKTHQKKPVCPAQPKDASWY